MTTTTDLSRFGAIEREEAGKLLLAYQSDTDKTRHFDDYSVTVMLNTLSGNVFLTNENCEVAMMDGDDLVDFLTCPICINEGLITEKSDWATNDCCKEYLKELGE